MLKLHEQLSRDPLLQRISQHIPIKRIHWLVVVISLIATLTAWQLSLRSARESTQIKFMSQADNATDLFEQQMYRYADILNAGVGFIAGSEEVLPEEWRNFTQRIAFEEQFPAIGGMGVVYYVEVDSLDEFVGDQRRLRPGFTIRPEINLSSIPLQQYVLPLTLIAPQRLEANVPGLDIAREARRRDAIERSIKTGTVQITAPIRPENTDNHGFAMIAPVFKTTKPETEAQRRSEFVGAVVAAVITDNLAEGILASGIRQVALKVSDDSEVIYNELVSEDMDVDPQPMMTSSRTVSLFGRDWRFELHSTKTFRLDQSSTTPTLILIGGLIIDALLLLLFMHMSRANERANALSNTISLKSDELKRSNDALADRNVELEAFSYLVSHDLKAPLRGIESLVDYIEEDIVNSESDIGLSSEITDSVKRIKTQVTLAQALVKGVLQYSGLGSEEDKSEEVNIRELLHSLRDMLIVEEAQLQLVGEFPTFVTNQTKLAQVFMNLISNAYKYHHGEGLAVVTVGIIESPLTNFYRFTVADNGPGIAEIHHKKIFEPFSTLQPKDHSMSSGVGLAIVKKLINQYGGTIEVTSKIGHGTCFTFDWPCTVDLTNTETRPSIAQPPTQLELSRSESHPILRV